MGSSKSKEKKIEKKVTNIKAKTLFGKGVGSIVCDSSGVKTTVMGGKDFLVVIIHNYGTFTIAIKDISSVFCIDEVLKYRDMRGAEHFITEGPDSYEIKERIDGILFS